ncbi:ciliogenesis-associated TTC17-interacting protein isoform X3 [Dipodomys merriami]|uniref:ciliogenesis-associated TTC17-interacting protein isoform X3 n=1 Tax=Dipodomys merriami TaxID=94247 RepID=UPI00384C5D12
MSSKVHFPGMEELQMLFFSETLAIISDTGEPQGELTIQVERGKYKDELGIMSHCVFVHAFSRGFLDKTLSGNSLLGYVSRTLELMEQHSQEFIKFLILPMERKMSLLKQDDQIVIRRSIKEGEEVKTGTSSFPWKAMKGFISEAANMVLLRVMAWRHMVPNNARFLALDSEGKLCYCTYEALGVQTFQVGRQQAEVFIVEQTVHSTEGIPMACQFYLLPDGHLAKRVQVGSPGCCIISKMPVLREKDEDEPQPQQFEKKPLVWEEDLELFSRFLERKTWSPSPPSTSAPSPCTARRPPACAPPTGPALSDRWTTCGTPGPLGRELGPRAGPSGRWARPEALGSQTPCGFCVNKRPPPPPLLCLKGLPQARA